MFKIIIWGTGQASVKIMKILKEDVKILAFIDNNKEKQGNKFVNNIEIHNPDYLNNVDYDYILIGSSFESEIYKQLINEIKVDKKKILFGLSKYENIIKYDDIFNCNKLIGYVVEETEKNNKLLVENNYRNKFLDTVIGLEWWKKDTMISAGDWAVGYNYFYYIVRVLNTLRPESILELGLGQSSKAISNYYNYYYKSNEINYEIIEQDAEWVEFFKNENEINETIKIQVAPLKKKYVKNYDTYVNVYTNFKSIISNKKYNLISIDGPWGSDEISRIDILGCIPECLEKSFVIIVDDYQRFGEKNMISELKEILIKNNIAFSYAIKESVSDICIITSEDLKFLCTM